MAMASMNAMVCFPPAITTTSPGFTPAEEVTMRCASAVNDTRPGSASTVAEAWPCAWPATDASSSTRQVVAAAKRMSPRSTDMIESSIEGPGPRPPGQRHGVRHLDPPLRQPEDDQRDPHDPHDQQNEGADDQQNTRDASRTSDGRGSH